jgi:hypothetical protein
MKKLFICFMILSFVPLAFADDILLQDSTVTTSAYPTGKYKNGVFGYDKNKNQYIYLWGVASLSAHNVVAVTAVGTTVTSATRLTETVAAKGYPLAIAMDSTAPGRCGWFMVKGKAVVSSYANSANVEYFAGTNSAGYINPTAWYSEGTQTTPIHGIAIAGATGGSATAYVMYPHTGN